jgi:hypothetical protein
LAGGSKWRLQQSPEIRAACEAARKVRVEGFESPWDTIRFYQCWLSAADGTKVAGYADLWNATDLPNCSCGAAMEHLVTFSTGEFDGATWGRWLPIEDRHVLTDRGPDAEQLDPGWVFGDAGRVYLFICRRCKEWPITYFRR